MSSVPPRPLVSLLDATFRLGERLVFPNTSWTVHRGEQWAVLGANGSGKSLLAECLRGHLPLVQGRLDYHFRPQTHLAPEQTIGHVSFEDRILDSGGAIAQSRWNSLEQDTALTLRDYLSYDRVMDVNPFEITSQHARARPGFERRLRRAIDLLDLRVLLDRTVLSLSNGETQRAQLARALCHPLRLLILDEPFNGLDTAHRRHFALLLERLMRSGLPTVLVTTRADDLTRHSTHVVLVEQCRVVAVGPRKQLLKRHQPFKPRRNRALMGRTPEVRCRPSPGRILVQLAGVTVRYGSVTILENIDWTIRGGESWALLGPNGSGKSTLLSLIDGDNPQSYRNCITVFGRRRGCGESIWQLKSRIGSVSPELHLQFERDLTCFEVVASGFAETVGLFEPINRRKAAQVRRWLRKFQLDRFAETLFPALSAGLQRMVLLARALVKTPSLLLLDEPCQGLDEYHRRLFISTLDSLLRAGVTTAVFVTHHLDEIPPCIRRVLRLDRGRARQEQTRRP